MDDNVIEIYFCDLIPEKQQQTLDTISDNGNYDIIFIATILISGEEDA